MKHHRLTSLSCSGPGLLALSILVSAGPAAAQRPILAPAGEAELPDIDAIEKGARVRAAVSFGGSPMVRTGQEDGNVKRLEPKVEESKEIPAGGIYGVEDLNATDTPPEPDGPHAASIPVEHVVKDGDTLWSLCTFYFRDPWCWPRLWASNPHITNPHWIFPGDVVKLREPDAPSRPPAPAAGPRGLRITSNRRGSLDSKSMGLRQLGFIEAKALAEAGRLVGSKEEKIMLSTGDQAYVGFPKDQPLRAGDKYTIFVADRDHPIVAPDTGEVLGYMVYVYGDIVVDQVLQNQTARGTFVDLVDPVERGYSVSPHVRQYKLVEPRPSTVTLEARVVASFSPALMLATESFVVLSRGKRDGVEVGNRSFVVRRGDGYRRIMEGWEAQDPRFPREMVSELWVVDVREKTSVAWVASTTKELRVGETAEIRRGY
jgi:hypothetical protein